MATNTISVRVKLDLLEKCDKVAELLSMNRNQLFCVVLERVCDDILEEVKKNEREK